LTQRTPYGAMVLTTPCSSNSHLGVAMQHGINVAHRFKRSRATIRNLSKRCMCTRLKRRVFDLSPCF